MPHHPTKPAQLELFALSDQARAAATPQWRDLPAPTRRTITGLMARLLMEHSLEERTERGEDSPAPAGENGDV